MFRPDDPDVNGYDLLTSLVVPRPIAWITTVDADGIGNLAPHSFFNVACARPPMVSFTSIGRKDTLRNVLAVGDFVVNIVSHDQAELANASSARFDADVDEAEVLGIRLERSDVVEVPRVANSMAAIECTLHTNLDLDTANLVIGEVRAISVRDEALVGGRPVMDVLRPVSRLGRNEWGLPPEVFRLDRPGRPPSGTSSRHRPG
ncbi:flavin reductase (DIM6/NTAB) family NADH-FMN oxidoreductase RutF [Janibacter cremeus]|uniref:Flavin reductase (DIM6/NTAB) family NADH-FMN oxidoreductase RutF n=1 Tax=Janibacter cremeus TaxID=1285192 RepID=A0A852VMG8_9MICO|nr:flavin reductase (DIM6/NTAB) family NADH-FMN oxidoreductase RutF [Janibacter cremeus]